MKVECNVSFLPADLAIIQETGQLSLIQSWIGENANTCRQVLQEEAISFLALVSFIFVTSILAVTVLLCLQESLASVFMYSWEAMGASAVISLCVNFILFTAQHQGKCIYESFQLYWYSVYLRCNVWNLYWWSLSFLS